LGEYQHSDVTKVRIGEYHLTTYPRVWVTL
jgi:hypothetical protein